MRSRRDRQTRERRPDAPWRDRNRGLVYTTAPVLGLFVVVQYLDPDNTVMATVLIATLLVLLALGVRQRRQSPDVEAALRGVIGKTVFLGIATDARHIAEVYGRVLSVELGRVHFAVAFVEQAWRVIDFAHVIDNADTWGIRLDDVRWLRDAGSQITF